MTLNRKDFIRNACLTGMCMCGFSVLATAKKIKKQNESLTLSEDSNLELIQEWIAELLTNLNNDVNKELLHKTIKKNAIVHYNNLKMDEVLKEYENNPEKFIVFLEEKWGWKIEYNVSSKTLIANENKKNCVCPMVNKEKGASSALCYCSEGFAEKMFSRVFGKPVIATVITSIHRGDTNCQYKIRF